MFGASDSSISFGRIAGAPVRIGPGSVLLGGYFAYVLGSQWMEVESIGRESTLIIVAAAVLTGLGFVLSILAHEAGHAVVAKRNGISTKEIRLSLFGGVAALERGAPTPSVEMKVAFAGPGVNLVIGAVGLGVYNALGRSGVDSVGLDALLWLSAINLFLGVLNLLPALPLDGGRILTGFLWRRREDRGSAVRSAAKIGKGVAYLAFAVGVYELVVAGSIFGFYTLFIGMILLRGADSEVARASLVDAVKGRTVSDVARFQPSVVTETTNTASARALLPSPDATRRWAVVTDEDGIARGLVDLVMLNRVASMDGTNPVADVMVSIDQQRAAFASESLEGVLERGVMLPFVVIDQDWRPVAIVDQVFAPQASV